jgi:putative holliday junction resolvase
MSVDVGSARVGVAATDPERRLAFPVETVPRDAHTVERIVGIAVERRVVAVFVGLPKTLSGGEGASATDARLVAGQLAELLGVPVRLIDERFSTSTATATLHEAGRDTRRQRAIIDQAAAVVILESALDGEKNRILDSLTEQARHEESHDGSV